ncbi:LisH motif domain-containing protein [Moniliophthora roreri]|nr:LisH motif domain-containing protein [Moniliophthora roreri]
MHEVPLSKHDLNRLIMDYLVIEGYKSAAQEFATEASIPPQVDMDSIESRMGIREALQRGDVESAIDRVNELNPEILDTNPSLFFHLQQQRVIELIRSNRIAEALEFAQNELAPRGEENPEFLAELEKTMSLLAFDSTSRPEGLKDLLGPGQRLKTAGEMNGAILESLSQGKEPKLVGLLRLMSWGNKMLKETAEVPVPLPTSTT